MIIVRNTTDRTITISCSDGDSVQVYGNVTVPIDDKFVPFLPKHGIHNLSDLVITIKIFIKKPKPNQSTNPEPAVPTPPPPVNQPTENNPTTPSLLSTNSQSGLSLIGLI